MLWLWYELGKYITWFKGKTTKLLDKQKSLKIYQKLNNSEYS